MIKRSFPNWLRWWLTPKFPQAQILKFLAYHPQGLRNIWKNRFRTWLLHPLKRRAAKVYLLILKGFFGLKVIGITGSAGKTTTKEMLASILKKKGKTIYSYANIDPVFNIPTTILRCRPTTRYLVLEMGVEYPGEMDFYLWLACPDIGVITNIYPTHTEFLGNLKGVLKEKSKLVKALSSNSTAVLNCENHYLRRLKGKIKAKIIWFGKGGEVSSSTVKFTSNFRTSFELVFGRAFQPLRVNLPILGRQFIQDALAASAAALALGISPDVIKNGLEDFENLEHRMKIIRKPRGIVILDDSYNNNPAAAEATLTTFKEIAGGKRKVIIFGDMLELGKETRKYHLQIGALIGSISPAKLICIGKASFWTAQAAARKIGREKVERKPSWQEALSAVKEELQPGTFVLVKGSRSMELDRLVSGLI